MAEGPPVHLTLKGGGTAFTIIVDARPQHPVPLLARWAAYPRRLVGVLWRVCNQQTACTVMGLQFSVPEFVQPCVRVLSGQSGLLTFLLFFLLQQD